MFEKTSLNWSIPAGRNTDWKRRLEPDLVFDYEGKRHVYDVKYKSYDFKYGVKREDLFQLHTYLGQALNSNTPITSCGLIYPISENKWHENLATTLTLEENFTFASRNIPFKVCFLKVPNSTTDNFRAQMKVSELQLLSAVLNCS